MEFSSFVKRNKIQKLIVKLCSNCNLNPYLKHFLSFIDWLKAKRLVIFERIRPKFGEKYRTCVWHYKPSRILQHKVSEIKILEQKHKVVKFEVVLEDLKVKEVPWKWCIRLTAPAWSGRTTTPPSARGAPSTTATGTTPTSRPLYRGTSTSLFTCHSVYSSHRDDSLCIVMPCHIINMMVPCVLSCLVMLFKSYSYFFFVAKHFF